MVYDFSGPESRPFSGPNRDPNGTAFRGPNRGPNRTTFRGPGLLAVDDSPGALWRPPSQSAHLYPPAILSGNGIRLFGARIRDPNGTAFRGPNQGPSRTTFRGPGLLAVHVSLGVLWRPPFLCPPAIFSGPEWYTTFRGPNPGPEWNSVSGPESGPYNRTTFRGPGLLAAHVSLGALWRPPFQSAHLCSPAFARHVSQERRNRSFSSALSAEHPISCAEGPGYS